jgi:hypothetical protein
LLGANVIIKLDIGSGYGAKSGKIITALSFKISYLIPK